ncbi:DUF1801 domain-containing protein [Robertkochia solimangrovi]|uniref:DUF1801 domain-containing protein n=1 Tax=Robertkochia solimangrovi TaxID=2213046 RepID=UPI00117E1A1D|nr:DUF1801 domain-containing protein [Robertkochia solimangrovi]TRZ43957.1 DUF1801 domain-containing protein [Robertkochia solimangrovi]
MKYEAETTEAYIAQLPEDRQEAVRKLRDLVRDNLPHGFEETMSYNMIGFVVPHALYPAGYHCNPELPLPFINIASQKNFIALYHSGIYADPELLEWFVTEYPQHTTGKLDMGKSCIRFKKPEQIPYELIAALMTRMTPEQWINRYESVIKRQ